MKFTMNLGVASTDAVAKITQSWKEAKAPKNKGFMYAREGHGVNVFSYRHAGRPTHSVIKLSGENAVHFRDVVRFISEMPEHILEATDPMGETYRCTLDHDDYMKQLMDANSTWKAPNGRDHAWYLDDESEAARELRERVIGLARMAFEGDQLMLEWLLRYIQSPNDTDDEVIARSEARLRGEDSLDSAAL